MLNKIIQECKVIETKMWNGITSACSTIKDGCSTFGRKVKVFTKEQIVKGAHYTAALMPFAIVPGLGQTAAIVALIAVHVFEKKLGAKTAKEAYCGIRNFCVIGVGIEALRIGLTLNPLFGISLTFYFACYLLTR